MLILPFFLILFSQRNNFKEIKVISQKKEQVFLTAVIYEHVIMLNQILLKLSEVKKFDQFSTDYFVKNALLFKKKFYFFS